MSILPDLQLFNQVDGRSSQIKFNEGYCLASWFSLSHGPPCMILLILKTLPQPVFSSAPTAIAPCQGLQCDASRSNIHVIDYCFADIV